MIYAFQHLFLFSHKKTVQHKSVEIFNNVTHLFFCFNDIFLKHVSDKYIKNTYFNSCQDLYTWMHFLCVCLCIHPMHLILSLGWRHSVSFLLTLSFLPWQVKYRACGRCHTSKVVVNGIPCSAASASTCPGCLVI